MQRAFRQVDVFSATPYHGNPVAVVLESDGLTTPAMQQFAAWMNLSETTFVLPPTDPRADYRVRIFTPVAELPFAGHPTLGTCHAWLSGGGEPAGAGTIVQECGAGLVPVRRTAAGLAFAAPLMVRSGPVDVELRGQLADALAVGPDDIVDAQWVDNGPGWVAVMLDSADAVLRLRPGPIDQDVGVVGPYPPEAAEAYEVRAFFPVRGVMVEDPVTGSLNASIAQWLVGSGTARPPYIVSQGTVLGRSGRVHITSDGDGAIWIGGATVDVVRGSVDL